MRFLVDAQLPPALARWLSSQSHSAEHLMDVGLLDSEDGAIWRHALENQAVILTKDEDFATRAMQAQQAPVIVWLRVGNCSNQDLLQRMSALLPQLLTLIEQGNRIVELR